MLISIRIIELFSFFHRSRRILTHTGAKLLFYFSTFLPSFSSQ